MYFITSFSTLCFVYCIYKWMKWYWDPHCDIPNPPSWPLLGHNWMFSPKLDLPNLFTEWAVKYKKYGMMRLFNLFAAPPSPTIFLFDVEDQKKIFSRPDIFERIYFLEKFFPLTGQGLLNAKGKSHQMQKRILGKALSMPQMKYYVPVFSKHADRLVKIWRTEIKDMKDGKNLVPKPYFNHYTFDAIAEIGFGQDFNSQLTTPSAFVQSFRDQVNGVYGGWKTILMMLPFLSYLPFGPGSAIHNARKNSQKLLDMVLETRKEKVKNGNLSETEQNDLLAMMMREVDPKTGEKFSDQLIKDNCYTFFIAGTETTSSVLPVILFNLAKYPKYQERCREEIVSVLKDEKENLTLDILEKFPFIYAFIKESLRLFPALLFTSRVSNVEVTVRNKTFSKNTLFYLPLYLNNTDEECYDFAKEFKPERYLDGSSIKNGTMFTFAYGPYNCVGKHFAMQEMRVAIVRLLQNFSFSIDPENQHFILQQTLSLQPFPQIAVRVNPL